MTKRPNIGVQGSARTTPPLTPGVLLMKYEHLKNLPVKNRQKMLGPDWNKKYFQGNYLIPVVGIVAAALINSMFALIYNQGLFEVILCNIIGIPAAVVVHLSIFSGFISSNTGSYFRQTEPVRYWFTLCFPFMGYVLTQIGMWYI